MNIFLRFHPSYVPIHRRIAGRVNDLLNAILQTNHIDITNMDNTEALAVIETAKTAITTARTALETAKATNAANQKELAELRDKLAAHDSVVQALNGQITRLENDDKQIDDALASLKTVADEPVGAGSETGGAEGGGSAGGGVAGDIEGGDTEAPDEQL